LVEFTGERVIPGQVEIDLWNEHLARYALAARYAHGRRVLDAGCGAGYGTAELARSAARALGIDLSSDAIRYAREHYAAPNLDFVQASAAALPVQAGSIDLAVIFEVVEHLPDWPSLLAEVRRILAPAGLLMISTPNKAYYAESRRLTGPNPYHVHEFEFDEFSEELRRLFPHVRVFLQNHVEAIGFQPLDSDPPARTALSSGHCRPQPDDAHFYLALCSLQPLPDTAAFFYFPSTANILRERELHIERLQAELATKDGWLEDLRAEKEKLVEMFRAQTAELERNNAWAQDLQVTLQTAQDRIVELQHELQETTAGYEAAIASQQARAQREIDECIRLLDIAENTVQERTAWALRLDAEIKDLQGRLSMVRASRWFKLGRTLGLGPVLPND
jgi:SAM-dependent methyltransferase